MLNRSGFHEARGVKGLPHSCSKAHRDPGMACLSSPALCSWAKLGFCTPQGQHSCHTVLGGSSPKGAFLPAMLQNDASVAVLGCCLTETCEMCELD
eukprot:1153343-Pelagomonas_calceolata.AAC.2